MSLSLYLYSTVLSTEPAKVTLVSVPSGDTQTLVCTIEDSHSGTLESFKWKKNDTELKDYIESGVKQIGEFYSAVSVLKVTNTNWNSKTVYTCEVTYRGKTNTRKISKGIVQLQFLQNNYLKYFKLDLGI